MACVNCTYLARDLQKEKQKVKELVEENKLLRSMLPGNGNECKVSDKDNNGRKRSQNIETLAVQVVNEDDQMSNEDGNAMLVTGKTGGVSKYGNFGGATLEMETNHTMTMESETPKSIVGGAAQDTRSKENEVGDSFYTEVIANPDRMKSVASVSVEETDETSQYQQELASGSDNNGRKMSQNIEPLAVQVVNEDDQMSNEDGNAMLVTGKTGGASKYGNSGGAMTEMETNHTMTMKSKAPKTIIGEAAQVTISKENEEGDSLCSEDDSAPAGGERKPNGNPKQNLKVTAPVTTNTEFKEESGKSSPENLRREELSESKIKQWTENDVQVKLSKIPRHVASYNKNHLLNWMCIISDYGLKCPSAVKDLPRLKNVDMVVFIDMDNNSGFVESFFNIMHKRKGKLKIQCICVQNRSNNFQPRQFAEIVSLEQDMLINVIPTSGSHKQESDNVIFMMLGQMDNDDRIRDSIPLAVLSGDKGFMTLKRCQNLLKHKVKVLNLRRNNVEKVVEELLVSIPESISREEEGHAVDIAAVRKKESAFDGKPGSTFDRNQQSFNSTQGSTLDGVPTMLQTCESEVAHNPPP